jgi:hypothetical protein
MTASEQVKIEFNAPDYLKNVIVIMTEMGDGAGHAREREEYGRRQ